MNKCVIYTRVSSEGQDYQSQIQDLEIYATSLHYSVVKIFSEKVSGYDPSKKRTEYDKMKAFVFENKINIILMWELSRLSRSTIQSLNEIKEFTDKKINIFFKKEGINTLSEEPSNKLLLSILSTMAEMERESIVERVTRGQRASAAKGKRTGFLILPYGYQADANAFLIIHNEEAKIIKLIYKLAAQGTPQRSIAMHLNSLKVPTRMTKRGKVNKNALGKSVPILWKPNAIGVILRNTLYKGERKYKDEVFEAPIIIEPNLWQLAQEKLKERTGYRFKRTKHKYLLKGFLKCGLCGRQFGARTETRYENKPSFYYCNGAKDLQIRCRVGQYKVQAIDNAVYEALFAHIDVFTKIKEEETKKFDVREKQTQIDFFKSQITQEEKRSKKMVELYADSFITKEKFYKEQVSIKNKVSEFDFNIKVIEDEISIFNSNDFNISDVYSDYANQEDFDKRKAFLDKFLNKVVMYKVTNNTIDFDEKIVYKLDPHSHQPKKVVLEKRRGRGRGNMAYIEIFAFGSSKPVKLCASTTTNLIFYTKRLEFDNGKLSLKD